MNLTQKTLITSTLAKVGKLAKVPPFPDVGEDLPNFLSEKAPKTSLWFHK